MELTIDKKDIQFNKVDEIDLKKSKLPWVYTDEKDKLKININLLAKYIVYGTYSGTNESIVEYIKTSGEDAQKNNSYYIYDYTKGIWKMVNEDTFKGYIFRFIPAEIRSNSKKSELWTEVKEKNNNKKNHKFDDFNSGLENYINFEDGMLNIETKELLPHSPKYLSTIQLPCKYKEILESKGKAPVFDKYMEDLCFEKPDYKQLLLEFIGAIVSNIPARSIKKILIMKGEGDTGKSQLRSLVEFLIGEKNSFPIQLSQLNDKYMPGYLYGKRLAGHGEASSNVATNLNEFKALTGGDQVNFARKFDSPISFVFGGLFWYNSNFFIKFGGDRGDWVYNRLIIMEFNNVIPEEKRDKKLLSKMKKEKNGIMYQVLQYLYKFVENDLQFDLNSDLNLLLQKCKEENSPAVQFINAVFDKTEKSAKEKTLKSSIYYPYQRWCDANKMAVKSKQNFFKELEDTLKDEDGSFFCNIHGTYYLRKYRFNEKKFELETNQGTVMNRFLNEDEIYESEYGAEKAAEKKILDLEEKKFKMEQKKKQEITDNINKITSQNKKYDDYFGKIGD